MELVNKKTAVGILAKVTDFGFPIITIPLLLSILGTHEYALLISLLSILSIFQVLINFGSEDLAQNDILNEKPIAEILGEIILTKLVVFAILFMGTILYTLKVENLFLSIFFLYLISEIFNLNFYFIYKNQVEFLLLFKIISKTVFLCGLIYFEISLINVIYVYIFQSFVYSLFVCWHLFIKEKIKPKFAISLALLYKGYKLVITNTSSVIRDKLPFILLDPSTNSSLIVVLDLIFKVVLVINSFLQTIIVSNLEYWRKKSDMRISKIFIFSGLISFLFLFNFSFEFFEVHFHSSYIICCVIASSFYFYSVYLAKFVYIPSGRYNELMLISIVVMISGFLLYKIMPLEYFFSYFLLLYFIELIVRFLVSRA